jgi:hypothetical protein
VVQQDRSRANFMLPAQPSRNELASFWLKTPGPEQKANYRHPLYAPNFKFRPAFTTSISVLMSIGNAVTVLIGHAPHYRGVHTGGALPKAAVRPRQCSPESIFAIL